jgi:hypothetical protein
MLDRVTVMRLAHALIALLASGCLQAAPVPAPDPAAERTLQIEWKELLPAEGRDQATLVPPAPLHDYLLGEAGPAASQPTASSVNPQLDRRRVRLPGFVVPLEIDAQGRVTQLLLVPYYGACIHVPPPPPNQIVLVTLAAPLVLGSMDTAYWVTGRLQVAASRTRIASTAYAITGATTEEYRF